MSLEWLIWNDFVNSCRFGSCNSQKPFILAVNDEKITWKMDQNAVIWEEILQISFIQRKSFGKNKTL